MVCRYHSGNLHTIPVAYLDLCYIMAEIVVGESQNGIL